MNLNELIQRVNRARIKLSCRLTQIQPQDLLEGYENLHVNVPMVSTHYETATLFDHMLIGSLVWALRPKVCFEIGTSLGLVTSTIAANAPEKCEIHTLDLSEDERIGSFFRGREGSRKIQQHVGASSGFDFSLFEGKVDLMFIDGSHEFEDVRQDSENAFRLLSKKGVVVWHDVSPWFPGVIRALESLPGASEIYLVHGTSCGVFASKDAPLKKPMAAERRSFVKPDQDAILMAR